MGNWFSKMNVRERRTFWACFTGWALDAMDVQIYAVVMPTLIAVWGLSQSQAGTLGTAALLFSSLGGWLAGILADRFGRAAVLRLTIVWFAGLRLGMSEKASIQRGRQRTGMRLNIAKTRFWFHPTEHSRQLMC
jgi:sugar phosphate permease